MPYLRALCHSEDKFDRESGYGQGENFEGTFGGWSECKTYRENKFSEPVNFDRGIVNKLRLSLEGRSSFFAQ